MQKVENLLAKMTSVVKRHRKQIQHRKMCLEERVWKSHLNYSFAKACLDLLYQSLDQNHGGSPEYRFTLMILVEISSLQIKPWLVESVTNKLTITKCQFFTGTASWTPCVFPCPSLASFSGRIQNKSSFLNTSLSQREPPRLLGIIWLHAKRWPTVRERLEGCVKQHHQTKGKTVSKSVFFP